MKTLIIEIVQSLVIATVIFSPFIYYFAIMKP